MQTVTYFDGLYRSGQEPTNAQIEGYIANLSNQIDNNLNAYIRSRQSGDHKDIGIFNISPEEYKSIARAKDQAFANLKTFLTSSNYTWDNKMKMLKDLKDKYKDELMIKALQDDGFMGAMARAELVAPGSANLMLNGAMAVDAMVQHNTKNGMTREQAVANVMGVADLAARAQDTKTAFAIYSGSAFLDSGFSLDAVMNFITGKDYQTGNPVVDGATAVRAKAGFNAEPSPEKRLAMAPGMMNNYDWNRLVKHPVLVETVRKDEGLKAQAVGMATRHVLSVLNQKGSSLDGVTFDPPRGVNAFNYKQPIGISRERTEAILELNRTYQHILRMFGGDTASQWVQSLVQPDTAHGLSTTGNFGIEKKDRYKDVRMGDTMSYVMERNAAAYGLPEELVMALGERESSIGYNLTNDKSSAAGPLAIIDSTFKTVNDQYFEGKLDPNNMYHRGEAALAHLADLYNKNGGDLNRTLLTYFSGRPDGWDVVDAHGTKAPTYIQDVYANMEKYRAM